jgi:hypothetical protein
MAQLTVCAGPFSGHAAFLQNIANSMGEKNDKAKQNNLARSNWLGTWRHRWGHN